MTIAYSRTPAVRAVLGTTATSFAVLLLATSGALAQDASSMETVTVTGFRASLENTIALKKEASSIVEAVSAEDIGKLPDQSIGEAISRLPGLATQRLNGRAQDISIRGLSPDFSTTLLNGREQVSSNDNRSVQYDQYPAELMSGVVIYKTPTADLVGAGLSGTVDMRTIRPLDYDHTVVSVNVRGETNSLGEMNAKKGRYGYRLGGTYIDQYANGKLGLVVGLSMMDSLNPYNDLGYWGWPNGNGGTGVPSSDFVVGGAKFSSVVDDLKRNAAMATLQYRPNENWESTLDLFVTQYRDHWNIARVEAPMYSWGGQDLLPGYTVTDGYVTAGTFTPGTKEVGREESDRYNNDLFALGWKTTYNSGNWTATIDAGYSSNQRHTRLLENWAGTGPASVTSAIDPMPFTLTKQIMHITPALDYGNYSNMLLTGPQCWSGDVAGVSCGAEGYLKYDKVHDHMFTLKGEAQYEVGGFFKSITAGIYYTNRTKTKSTDEYYLTTTAVVNAAAAYCTAHPGPYLPNTDCHTGWVRTGTPVPDQFRTGISNGLRYFGIPGFASWNPDAAFDSGTVYTATHNTGPWAYQKGFQVNEIVYTGYVKADIDTAVADHTLTGNVGLQLIYTHQTSNGYAVGVGDPIPLHDGANYVEPLPSLNLALELTDNSKIRLGAARELVRARMDQMVNVNSYSFSTTGTHYPGCPDADWQTCSPWSGTTGNAKLKPWIADAVDLSYEYYRGKGTYFALAGFYKNLETYIYTQSQPYDFTGYTMPAGFTALTYKGFVNQQVNGSGGQVLGFEVSGAVAGDAITDMLSGFGLTGNVSYTDSGLKGVSDSGPTTPLPGLSKLVYNATVYYENSGFSARVNYNYRTRYFAEIKQFDNTYRRNEFKAQGWLGAQVGYTFDEGTAKGLSINLQADNLLNERQTQYQFVSDPNDSRQILDWWRFGTTYQVSLTYKFE